MTEAWPEGVDDELSELGELIDDCVEVPRVLKFREC
jgi:hypothetical protein